MSRVDNDFNKLNTLNSTGVTVGSWTCNSSIESPQPFKTLTVKWCVEEIIFDTVSETVAKIAATKVVTATQPTSCDLLN